jgi:hypothetical protein
MFSLTGHVTRSATEWVFTAKGADMATLPPELRTEDGRLRPEAFDDLVVVVPYKIS